MAAGERFEPHVFESGVYQRGPDMLVLERRRDRITNATAQPDRDVQEIGWGMVHFVSHADPVVVDPCQKESANLDFVCAFQHGGEKTAALRATGQSGERQGPTR